MFDGLQRIRTYYIDLELPYRFKLGVIACVTPDVFHEKSSFRRLGFLSRLIPFSFNYCHTTVDEILGFVGTIQEDKLRMETIKVLKHKKANIEVSEHYLSLLTEKAKDLAKTIDMFCPYYKDEQQRLIGTRAKHLLTCYLKALALANGNNSVTENDWQEFLVMFGYMNFDMRRLP